MTDHPALTSPSELSQLEEMLELSALSNLGPDLFISTRKLWHPPGGRGVFGGVAIAQCLAAAQRTVRGGFFIHSMHCYFLLAGNSNIPITFSVQRVPNGKSFATRTVLASQEGNCILTSTMSFNREGSGGKQPVCHASPMPHWLQPPSENYTGFASTNPYAPQTLPIAIEPSNGPPQAKRMRAWVILAFISDWNFISGVPLAHNLWDFPEATSLNVDVSSLEGTPVGMLSSLNHTIFFHEPFAVRSDEWMLVEIDSAWSGGGRGLVAGKIFSKDGTLLATCIQEGVVRLREDPDIHSAKI